MKIEMGDLGTLETEGGRTTQFSQPIFGSEEYGELVLINDPDVGDGICWLQSVEEKQVCFIILNPLGIKPGYTPVANDGILDQLKAELEDELDCWVLPVIGKTFQQSTADLGSPIVVNHRTNLAMQMILDQDYAIRQPVFGEGEVDVY